MTGIMVSRPQTNDPGPWNLSRLYRKEIVLEAGFYRQLHNPSTVDLYVEEQGNTKRQHLDVTDEDRLSSGVYKVKRLVSERTHHRY